MLDISEKDSALQKNIKRKMNTLGWSLRRLSREAGVQYSTIRGIFDNNHDPRASTVREVARALGVSVARLHEEDDATRNLSTEQKDMLDLMEHLSPQEREMFMALLHGYVKGTMQED